MITKRRALESLALTLCAPAVWAQKPTASGGTGAWPVKPVRLLVGFPAGASPDLAARAIAAPLSKALGQPVLVENKPGDSGNLAADLVAKAQDDHTIGALINGNLTIAKLLNPKTPFDPEKDFAPVAMVGTAPLVLAVTGKAQGATPTELLLWARNLSSQGRYGTPGIGTVGHLGMELVKSRSGILATHVPFTGNPQVIAAMLAGDVQLALLPPALVRPHLQSGKLKAIGVTSPQRSPLSGDMPTHEVPSAELEAGIMLAALAADAGLAGSRGEARRLAQGGGLRVNDKAEADAGRMITKADLVDGVVKLAAGKKKIILVKPV